MRVLHLLEAGAGGRWHEEAVLACRAAITAGAGEGVAHEVWIIGPADSAQKAARLGVPAVACVCPPAGLTEGAWRAARRLFARASRPDIVMCWSVGAMAMARLSGIRGRIGIGALLDDPSAWTKQEGLLRRGLSWRDATTFTCASVLADRWRRAGAEDVRVLPPTRADARVDVSNARRRAREWLGLDPSEAGVVLLGDPAQRANLRRFVFLVGLLHVAGKRVVAIAPRGAAERDRAARFVRAHHRAWRLLEWEGPLRETLAGADLAICDLAGDAGSDLVTAGPLLLAAAAEAGLPIVSGPHPVLQEAIEIGADCHLARGFEPTALAASALPVLTQRVHRAASVAQTGSVSFRDMLLRLWLERLDQRLPMASPAEVACASA